MSLPLPTLSLCGAALLLCALAMQAESASARGGASPDRLRVYIGTYTGPRSKGIYLSELDLKTGKLSPATLAGESVNPSFVAIHPNHRFLYAVNEVENVGGHDGGVSAYRIDPRTGKLTFLNQQPSKGAGPCFITADRAGKNVLVANYGSGSVAVLPIKSDGTLGPATAAIQHHGSSVDPRRQKEPHAHSINLDAANRYAFAADLGLDKILIYRFDPAKGTLAPNDPAYATVAPGSGPRHFAWHPSGKWAYVISEMGKTVTGFGYDPKTGALKSFQAVSTVPAGYTKGSCAEVEVHPSGKFLYGSNRGHDSIAIFSIDQQNGRLTALGSEPTQGKTPRNFAIDPSGRWLLAENQDSGTIVVFRIDPATGKLTPTGSTIEVASPVCVRFLAPSRA